MNMAHHFGGIMDESDREPESRGERAARYLDAYLRAHEGLSTGELAFRIKADKRDIRRLLNEHTIGWRLDEGLAAYFGDDYVEAMYRPVIGSQSKRLREIERERAEIAAREARLVAARAAAGGARRLVSVEDGARTASSRLGPGTVG